MAENHVSVPVQAAAAVASGASVTARIASNFWIKWTEISIEHARLAQEARERALATSSEESSGAYDEELKAGLVAVVAAAFAVDAWEIAVRPMVNLPAAATP